MKNSFAYLLFIAVGALSLSSFSTELSTRTNLRDRINAKISAQSCKELLTRSESSGKTRGAQRTRSGASELTRGGFRSAIPKVGNVLPEKVENYSRRYALVLAAEFGLPYGFEHDPNSYYFLIHDPYEGSEKLQILREQGYEWNGSDSPVKSPTWLESVKNSQSVFIRRGIDLNKTWRYAITLYRKTGTATDPKTGKISDKLEYLFIDPLTESFPSDMSSWEVLTKDVQFNIPFNAIFEAMKQRKFPLLDANHDNHHLVAAARFPELYAKIIEMIQIATPDTVTLGFKKRQYWLTEALSLPDPNNQKQNHSFLKSQGRKVTAKSLGEVEAELSQMKESDLLNYSLNLARYFESQLRDVSGGNSNPAEKWFYLSESFGMKAKDLIDENITAAERLDRVTELSRTYFENGPVTLNANSKIMTNETATFNFNTFVTSQKILTLLLKENNNQKEIPQLGWERKTAIKYLIQYMSRVELLLRQTLPTYSEWAEAFLQADLPMSNPIAVLLMDVFGNDVIKKFYLGVGMKRRS